MKVRKKINIRGGELEEPKGNYYLDQGAIREFDTPAGITSISAIVEELDNMTDVLLGRSPAPINEGVATMLEVADAYYARASEMTALIQRLERRGQVTRADGLYKLRTGEIRTFMDMAKRCAETGSRRLTYAQMRSDAERRGRDSDVDDFPEPDYSDRM